MPSPPFKVTIHMVSSFDGIIAKKDNSVDWFETSHPYEKGVDVEHSEDFSKLVDCYVMGARTYEHAVELSRSSGWVYGDVPTVVITHKELPAHKNNIQFYSGDLNMLVEERLKPNFSNVWVIGGAQLIKDFIRLKLANEIRLSVLPIILGEGIPLFDQVGAEQVLQLKEVLAYKTGMVELWYEIKNGNRIHE